MNIRTILRALSSLALTTALLLLLALLVVYGTLFQVGHGVFDAQQTIFNAWFFTVAGFIPLPGVKLVVSVLFLNLVAAGIMRMSYSWRKAGIPLIHAGIALLLVNAAFSYVLREEYAVALAEGESASVALVPHDMDRTNESGKISATPVPLPITVRLNRFVIRQHPGSGTVSDYESHLHVRGDDIDRNVVVSMNRPFRYRDYTFYQSSYQIQEARRVSSLAVVKNPIRIAPYIASIMIAFGLALHFLIRMVITLRRRNA